MKRAGPVEDPARVADSDLAQFKSVSCRTGGPLLRCRRRYRHPPIQLSDFGGQIDCEGAHSRAGKIEGADPVQVSRQPGRHKPLWGPTEIAWVSTIWRRLTARMAVLTRPS